MSSRWGCRAVWSIFVTLISMAFSVERGRRWGYDRTRSVQHFHFSSFAQIIVVVFIVETRVSKCLWHDNVSLLAITVYEIIWSWLLSAPSKWLYQQPACSTDMYNILGMLDKYALKQFSLLLNKNAHSLCSQVCWETGVIMTKSLWFLI